MSVLGDSASCSAGANPLAQMNKYMSADRSLQREHQVSGSGSQGSSLRGTEFRNMSEQDRQLYQSMHQGGRQDAFRFEEFRKDVPMFEHTGHSINSRQDRNWGAEFASKQQQGSMNGIGKNGWASEFSRSGSPAQLPSGSTIGSSMSSMPMASIGHPGFGLSMGMERPYMMGSQFAASQVAAPVDQQQSTEQQQGTVEAAKWEEEFKKMERHASPQAKSESSTQGEGLEGSATASAEASTFDQHPEGIIDMDNLENPEQLDQMFGNNFPPNWDEMWDNINDPENAAASVRGENFRAASGLYDFAKDNEFANEDDPFAMGVYMMDNGAKLSCAALCFEEAVKRDPSHVEAWARLGDAQAQNEVEDPAIVALERAVSLNPRHDRALLNLAISYTNEGYDAAASQILEKWIAAKYPDIAELVPGVPSPTREQLHERVRKMFLTAAQRSPSQGMDPDVQVGLGVLCYREDDYEKAIDCFRSALSIRPNDASLWNRLGATLANASHSEEAIDAYYKALELRPSFVRARYNLAVSCINIGCYREAAENILSAISLHDAEDGDVIDFNRSSNLIDTLRRVFFAMDRRDLLAKLSPGAKLSDFRGDFKF